MSEKNVKMEVQRLNDYFVNIAKLLPPSYKPKVFDNADESDSSEENQNESTRSKAPGRKRKKPVQLSNSKKKKLKPDNFPHDQTTKRPFDQSASENKKSATHINKDGKMVFSKFDFGNASSGKNKKEFKKKKKLENSIKRAQVLKEKLDNLRASNPGKASEVVEKDTWKKAADKAAGVKVKDDIKLMKKTLKRQQDKKSQSRKNWKERTDKVQDKMKKKQTKRFENIKNKSQSKGKFKKRRVQGF